SNAPCSSMRRMKTGSIGEMPPSTRVNPGRASPTASELSRAMRPKMRHSGSSSKSQCERLFGSFQIIAASITRSSPRYGRERTPARVHLLPRAHVHLLLGVAEDAEARAPQHRLRAGAVGEPPVGVVSRVGALDE